MRLAVRPLSGLLLLVVVAALGTCAVPAAERELFTQKPVVLESRVRQSRAAKKEKEKPANTAKAFLLAGPKATWIWGPDPDSKYVLQKQFMTEATKATLIATCDNVMTLYVNGKKVASGSDWNRPSRVDVSEHLRQGKNVLRAEVANTGGPAGFVMKLALTSVDGKVEYVTTDRTWRASANKDADPTLPVKALAKMGRGAWGDVFSNTDTTFVSAEDRGVFNTLPGFQVELLYTVPKETQGSWVSIAFDNKGRLIASDQGNKGLFRITPPPIGGRDTATRVERLDVNMTASQGMLYAFGSLYVSVNGGPGSGLYRLRDTDRDDQYDEVEKLKALRGGGEHGPHALRLSPDGKSIYIVAGNHTDPPADFDASRMQPNWSEDLLLPRQWDARGHARGKLAPGGWVARTDPDGKTWEIYSNGYRNSYDMAFNADGELFVYDADMEWDMGTPWYRPTRVVHATSGSEFGWRSGTGKWPTYYVDSLPPVLDVGPGSPVGVTFGYGTKFPARFQKALYLLDWTFGTIYAVHLTPDGASYTGEKQEFLSRTPLPLTDAAVGPDGALYFAVGGRGTQSELFRVTYVGDESANPVDARNEKFADLRALRQRLESYHVEGHSSADAVDFIWPHLGHADRFIRFAARTALEHQPVELWQRRTLAEKDPQTLITAMVALARQGDKSVQPAAIDGLARIDFESLPEPGRLELLRVYSLLFTRMGQPDQQTAARIAKRLDPFYPAESDDLNRELSRVLVYLNSPTVITKTLALMEKEYEQSPEVTAELLARNARYGGTIAQMLANLPEIQKIHYALVLRNMRYGWTLNQRRKYFRWFESAAQRSGGASYQGFIQNIRDEALANASPAERKALQATTIASTPKPAELPKPKGPGHDWTLAELVKLTEAGLSGRDFENGKRAYAASRCVVCHRFDGNGGATGPDLTNVAGRFSYRDLNEALVEPSKVVSDQYRASVIETTKGKVITGRVVSDSGGKVTVLIDPEDATKIAEIPKDEIEVIVPSKVSLMPDDLLKVLGKEEVLDLLAYLMSRGNPKDAMFAE